MSSNLKVLFKLLVIFLIFSLLSIVVFINSGLRDILYNSSVFNDQNTRNLLLVCTIVFLIFTSWLGSFLANRRGRDRITWAVICFITSIWGLLALFLLPDKMDKDEGIASNS
jgi:hypothetical protein